MPQALLLALVIPFCAVVLTSGFWVPLLFWLHQRRVDRRFAALGAELGATREGDRLVVPTFEHGAVVRLHVPSRSSPWVLEVAIPLRGDELAGPPVLLRAEGGLDRLGKRLGLNREVQIGDAPFDRAVYIETDAPDEAVRGLLGDEARRRAVIEILGAGFSVIHVHTGGARVSASRPRPGAVHLASETVRRVAQSLALLAPAVPAPVVPADGSSPKRRPVLAAAFVVLFLAGLVAFFGAPMGMLAIRDACTPLTDDVYYAALDVAGALFLAALPMVALAVRGHSDSLRTFVVAALALLYALPFYTMGTFLGLNAGLDGSRPARHPSRVLEQWVTHGKQAGNHLRFAALRRGEEPIERTVDAATYARFVKGDAAFVITGEGALGWEWIEGVEPARKR
jgi:hypothetical protein